MPVVSTHGDMTPANHRRPCLGVLSTAALTAILLASPAGAKRPPAVCAHPKPHVLSKIDVIEKGGSNTVPGTTKTEHLTTMNGCGGKEEQFVAKWAKPWWEWAFKVTGTAGGKVLNIVKAELKVEAGGTYHGRQEGYEKTIKSIPCKKFNVNKVTKTSVTTYMVHAGVEEQHFCSECGRYVGSHKEWSGWCLATRKDHIESIAETPPQNCGAT